LLLTSIILITTPHSCLAHEYHFPGKGSRVAWERANDLNTQAAEKEHSHKPDQAIALLKRAIVIYPFDPYFYKNLGLIYENDKKDFAKAERLYQTAIHMSPTNATFLIGHAGLLFDEGKIEQSKQALRKAEPYIKSDEERANAQRLRSFLYAN